MNLEIVYFLKHCASAFACFTAVVYNYYYYYYYNRHHHHYCPVTAEDILMCIRLQ